MASTPTYPLSPPPLATMRHITIRVVVATLFTHLTLEVTGPANIVGLVLAGVKAAASRWPAVVTVTEH
jgi:hypothetical protein